MLLSKSTDSGNTHQVWITFSQSNIPLWRLLLSHRKSYRNQHIPVSAQSTALWVNTHNILLMGHDFNMELWIPAYSGYYSHFTTKNIALHWYLHKIILFIDYNVSQLPAHFKLHRINTRQIAYERLMSSWVDTTRIEETTQILVQEDAYLYVQETVFVHWLYSTPTLLTISYLRSTLC